MAYYFYNLRQQSTLQFKFPIMNIPNLTDAGRVTVSVRTVAALKFT